MPELFTYRNFLFTTPAYEWLLSSLRRELFLAPAEPTFLQTIEQKILSSIPASNKVSKKRSADSYVIYFKIEWDPLAFIKEQGYTEEPHEAIEIAITLTGCSKDAQALTCGQYMCQTWPSTGPRLLRLIKDLVRSGPGRECSCKFSGLSFPDSDIPTDEMPNLCSPRRFTGWR
jgi:hypothetical protein